MMILVDALIVHWVAVNVAVSLLIKPAAIKARKQTVSDAMSSRDGSTKSRDTSAGEVSLTSLEKDVATGV